MPTHLQLRQMLRACHLLQLTAAIRLRWGLTRAVARRGCGRQRPLRTNRRDRSRLYSRLYRASGNNQGYRHRIPMCSGTTAEAVRKPAAKLLEPK